MSSKSSAENLKEFLAVRPLPDRPGVYDCDRWRIDAEQRVLFLDQTPVPLAPRDFDLLAVLVEHAGRVVSKEELLKRVWGPVIVEEGNLASHVSVLRAVLARVESTARAIETVPKRGYRFAATLDTAPRPLETPASVPTSVAHEAMPVVVPQSASRQLEDSPHEVSGPAPTKRIAMALWRKFALAAAAVVALWAGIAGWRAGNEPHLPFAERDWLLVADFENQTGDVRFDAALLTALTVSLEQSQFVNVYPRSRLPGVFARMQKPQDARLDEALAREICTRESVRALVAASITRTGTQYALAARLVDPTTGTAIRSYWRQVPDESELLASLQEIGSELRRDLGESLAGIAAADRPLAEVTTPDLDALRMYSEGQRNWEIARYGLAVDGYKAALAVDSEFAMAHAALGRAYYSYAYNRVDLGLEHFQRALALTGRTSARERLMIEADFAAARRDWPRAIELYQRHAALYPRDVTGRQNLGQVYLNAGQLVDAVDNLQLALKEDPTNPKLLNNAAVAYAKLDRFGDAIPLFERAIQADSNFLERHNFRFNYATILFGAGQRERARQVMLPQTRAGNDQDRAWRALGLYAQFEGRYRDAAEYFTKAVAAPASADDAALARARNLGFLASVLAIGGDTAAAREHLVTALGSLDAHGTAPAYFRARLAAALADVGAVAEARAELRKLAALAEEPTNKMAKWQIAAAIAAANGEHLEAVRLSEQALAASPDDASRLLVRYLLARELQAAGETERAIAAYDELARVPRGQWLGWEAQSMHQLARLSLARLHAARGDTQLASEAVAPLQDDWRHADKDFPPVRELARLVAALTAPANAAVPERLAAAAPNAPAKPVRD
jgi:DNA-binding winged helix-turn-helix (wHTH) protein/tetratricopeptide (TPR) repeat protein